ncbi:hypothetical protein GCM10009839_66150 [Catenulispora yoronensis]|uniref:Uncharacterized protein n=1 Tax=Catenulispora yoronensis TaxID=450799 RepID=A0ABP5GLM5_9ACTN
MTEHSDDAQQAGLRTLLTGAAEDVLPASAPYDAIVGDARRRIRVRAIGGSALSVVALGAAVAVGVSSFAGGADATRAASGGNGPGAAALTPATSPGAQAAKPQAAPPTTPVAPFAPTSTPAEEPIHYGKTVIAQGVFKGVPWTLARELTKKDGVVVPVPGGETKQTMVFDDTYFVGPNSLRDRGAGGGGTSPDNISALLKHFSYPNADLASSTSVTCLGVGAMDNSWKKENSSPYGISFVSGIVAAKVARVQVVFKDGTTQDATLVAAPADEDGKYFYLPFANQSWHSPGGTLVYYDAQGKVLKPKQDAFSQF